MTKEDIELLFEYDRWANSRVLQAASALSSEQFTRNLGSSFPSVRDTLLHIIGGEWSWLNYWNEPYPDATFVAELKARREVLFNAEAFPSVAALQATWREMEKELSEFVERASNELLEKMLPFRSTQLSLGQLMQHVANHSTYHRGQIALMMRQLNAEPIATDFHVFLAERSR
jgi:uncharacterized damage-inducible protein DinB